MSKEEIILTEVCNHFDLTPRQIFSNTRKREIVRPRQIYYYLCTKHTILSLDQIGRTSGQYRRIPQDHATVIHARNTIKNDMYTNWDGTNDIVCKISTRIKKKLEKDYVSYVISDFYSYLNNIEMLQYVDVTEKKEITFEKALV